MRRFSQRLLTFLLLCSLLFGLTGCENTELIAQVTEAQQKTEFNAPSSMTELPAMTDSDGRFTLPFSLSDTLDPHTCVTEINQLFMPLLYDGLFAPDGSGGWVNALCTDYTANEDSTLFRFTLRDAVFSDGSTLTASDAAYSINRARDTDSRFASRLSSVIACYVSDGQLCIETSLSSPRLPALLDIPVCKDGDPSVGCGAYVLSGTGTQLQLHCRKDWWKGTAHPVDTIYLRGYDSLSDLISAFGSREIDLVTTDFNSSSAPEFSGSYDSWDVASNTMLYVAFNLKQPIFTITASRRIMALGIDRETIAADIFGGYASPTTLPFPVDSRYYDEDLDRINRFSTGTLMQVMNENDYGDLNNNGYPDVETYYGWYDLNVDLLVNSESEEKVRTAQLIHDDFAKLGIEVTVKSVPYEEYLRRIRAGEFYMYLGEVTLSPDYNLYKLIGSNGAMNYGNYASVEMDTMLKAGVYDEAFLELFQQSLPFTPILFKTTSVLVHRGMVGNISPLPGNVFHQFENWNFG